MMVHMSAPNVDIDRMPRGGPDASCLDRLLQTDRPEYLDREDVDESVKRSVVDTLQRAGELFGHHQRVAHLVRGEAADGPDPRILRLGAGERGVSRRLLERHRTAPGTVS